MSALLANGCNVNSAGTIIPDFVVIGAMKSGTTTLFRHLSEHPEIGMSRFKETNYFVAEKNYRKGSDWYSAQFDPRYSVHGDVSPNYSKRHDFPGVAERLKQHCPDARLIYIVRDPVARAEAQVRHASIMGQMSKDTSGFRKTVEYRQIVDTSRYAFQLEEFLRSFDDPSFLVLDFDEFVRNQQSIMDQIFDFIGVSRTNIRELNAQNTSAELSRIPVPVLRFAQSGIGKSISGWFGRDTRDLIRRTLARGQSRMPDPLPDGLRERMRDELAADAERFRKMTGMRFSNWSV